MTRKLLVVIATVLVTAFASYKVSKSMNNSSTELSKITLFNLEALGNSERGCITRGSEDNGDCTSDGTSYFCENSRFFHDCVKGEYPN